jgi:hypothetical protein
MEASMEHEAQMDRDKILLRAAYDILKKCSEAEFETSPMAITVYYDEADCDGSCLMEDIARHIGLDDDEQPLTPND